LKALPETQKETKAKPYQSALNSLVV
jgi:hypothetical protein